MSAKQFADRAFHEFSRKTHYKNGSPFLLASASASDQTQAFVFAHFTKCAHHSNPSHKKFPLSQQLFHLSFNQKYNQKFRQRQKQNHQKKNCVFHISSSLHLQFNFYDDIPAINPHKLRLERHFFRFCGTDYFCGGSTDITGFFKPWVSGET